MEKTRSKTINPFICGACGQNMIASCMGGGHIELDAERNPVGYYCDSCWSRRRLEMTTPAQSNERTPINERPEKWRLKARETRS